MTTLVYNLIFLAVLVFAGAFVIVGLVLVIQVIRGKVTVMDALKIIGGSALLAGLVVSIGWSLLTGPSSPWITAPGNWGKEILNTPLNPWQPK